jgi:tRNA-uridine 2-sulfurtransferase
LRASNIPDAPARIAVGLSGGVDSCVAAWLLREAGHQVTALTMQIWNPALGGAASKRGGCYGPGEAGDLEKARQLAGQLGIEHQVVPLIQDYEKHVLEYYRSAYRHGLTPNPCAVCNPVMKFGLLPETARQSGLAFDFFATGHYVINRFDPLARLYRLFRGADPDKDQSYFLARLTQQQLAGSRFPLGSLTKPAVRQIAREIGLASLAEQPESQDFYDGENHQELFCGAPPPPGDIIDTTGRVLGKHRGIIHYTIGQREGLGIAAGRKVYVKEIRPATNQLVVADRHEVLAVTCRVLGPSWIAAPPSQPAQGLSVRLRYRHTPVPVRLETLAGDSLRLHFESPQFAVTPGQLAALYRENELLGGGWIAADKDA